MRNRRVNSNVLWLTLFLLYGLCHFIYIRSFYKPVYKKGIISEGLFHHYKETERGLIKEIENARVTISYLLIGHTLMAVSIYIIACLKYFDVLHINRSFVIAVGINIAVFILIHVLITSLNRKRHKLITQIIIENMTLSDCLTTGRKEAVIKKVSNARFSERLALHIDFMYEEQI